MKGFVQLTAKSQHVSLTDFPYIKKKKPLSKFSFRNSGFHVCINPSIYNEMTSLSLQIYNSFSSHKIFVISLTWIDKCLIFIIVIVVVVVTAAACLIWHLQLVNTTMIWIHFEVSGHSAVSKVYLLTCWTPEMWWDFAFWYSQPCME